MVQQSSSSSAPRRRSSSARRRRAASATPATDATKQQKSQDQRQSAKNSKRTPATDAGTKSAASAKTAAGERRSRRNRKRGSQSTPKAATNTKTTNTTAQTSSTKAGSTKAGKTTASKQATRSPKAHTPTFQPPQFRSAGAAKTGNKSASKASSKTSNKAGSKAGKAALKSTKSSKASKVAKSSKATKATKAAVARTGRGRSTPETQAKRAGTRPSPQRAALSSNLRNPGIIRRSGTLAALSNSTAAPTAPAPRAAEELARTKQDYPFVAVHLATSGIHPSTGRIVSVAAITFNAAGDRGEEFYAVLNPGTDPGPAHLHGLTLAEIAGGYAVEAIMPVINELVDDRTLVVADTARTWGFLTSEGRRAGRQATRKQSSSPRNRRRRISMLPHPSRIVDVTESARRRGIFPHDARLRGVAHALGLVPDAAATTRRALESARVVQLGDCDLLIEMYLYLAEASAADGIPLSKATPADLRSDRFGLQRSHTRIQATSVLTYDRHVNFDSQPAATFTPVVGGIFAVAPEVQLDPDTLITAGVRAGLKYVEKLSRQADVVVCNDPDASGKAWHAARLGIPMLRDEEFLAALKNGAQPARQTSKQAPDADVTAGPDATASSDPAPEARQDQTPAPAGAEVLPHFPFVLDGLDAIDDFEASAPAWDDSVSDFISAPRAATKAAGPATPQPAEPKTAASQPAAPEVAGPSRRRRRRRAASDVIAGTASKNVATNKNEATSKALSIPATPADLAARPAPQPHSNAHPVGAPSDAQARRLGPRERKRRRAQQQKQERNQQHPD